MVVCLEPIIATVPCYNFPMETNSQTVVAETEQLKAISWEAPEHHHVEKSSEWFAVVGILTLAAAAAAYALGNILFAVLIMLIGLVMSLVTIRTPEIIPYAVSARGIRVDDRLYPYTTLESYYIDEDDPKGPQLLLKGERLIMPLIVIPIPEDEVDEIEDIIAMKIPEEHLEESFFAKLLESVGF